MDKAHQIDIDGESAGKRPHPSETAGPRISQSLTSRIYGQVLQRLLSGEMVPGQVFNRRQIAAELGVSVAPVLETMVQLQAEGLIETLPRKGTRVRQPTREDLRGQLIVREALECQAARIACGEPVRRQYKHLQRMADRIDGTLHTSIEAWRDEVRFHHRLVLLAGVPTLSRSHDWIMKVGMFFSVHILHPAHASAPRDSHAQYVEALLTNDPDEAEKAVRTHIRLGKEPFFDSGEPIKPAILQMPGWLG
jgi:DNA-binding GntR family transcriptional regulator